jgi:long-chain acyl-CoA synthetase
LAYTAGEAIGPEIFTFYRSLGINIKQLYGMTEASVFVCVQPDGEVKPDTVGTAMPEVELKISDSGEVLYRSPGVFMGYYRNPEATAAAMEDGWVHSGDAGYLDENAHLKIIDRARDVSRLADEHETLFAPRYLENKLKFSQFIKEAVVHGADRPYISVFINIDLEAVGNWADRRGLTYTNYSDLAARPEVYDLIQGEIERVNASLAEAPQMAGAQIQRFLILHKELDPDDGELTRTRKVRRGVIAAKYGDLITALYSDDDHVAIEAQVMFEVGRSGTIRADLQIRDITPTAALAAAS